MAPGKLSLKLSIDRSLIETMVGESAGILERNFNVSWERAHFVLMKTHVRLLRARLGTAHTVAMLETMLADERDA